MKHLIIFAHPNQQSLNRALVERVVQASHEMNVETIVRDLYTLNFNPILSWDELDACQAGIVSAEVKFEQNQIKEADLITLVYPLWWMGFPAILKGYLDRVLSYGFAYQTENGFSVGLLSDKKMQHFINMGNNLERYQSLNFDKALQTCLVDGLFNFCGITDIQHDIFGDIHLLNEAGYLNILNLATQKTQENLTALLAKEDKA